MTLTPVQSSSINAIGYDADTRALHVEFSSGQTYHYPDVDPEAHQALVNAPSVGSHFAKHIRPHYQGRKV
jgi:hypothetical protein